MFAVPRSGASVETTKRDLLQGFHITTHKRRLALAVSVALLSATMSAHAEPVSINMPAQPMADALVQFAKKAGLSVAVDSDLVKGKTAPAPLARRQRTDRVSGRRHRRDSQGAA